MNCRRRLMKAVLRISAKALICAARISIREVAVASASLVQVQIHQCTWEAKLRVSYRTVRQLLEVLEPSVLSIRNRQIIQPEEASF
jgi:hypothetical protein